LKPGLPPPGQTGILSTGTERDGGGTPMTDTHLTSIATHFGHVTDPRVERTRDHNLLDILTIAMCAILAGADGPTGMETFGKAKEE